MSLNICNIPTFDVIKKEECYGCMVCSNICPRNAISFVADNEGYLYPKLDKNNCIHCGVCVKTCPAIHSPQNDAIYDYYCARALDDQIILKSSSGGVFSLLVKTLFELYGDKAYIAGAVYSDDFKSVHTICTSLENEISNMRTAKYVQSNKHFVFREIKALLEQGKYVLFTGTPCETAGLAEYLHRDYTNLVTVDFICKGSASPLVLKQYVQYLENKYTTKIIDINMRYKWIGIDSFIPQYIRVCFSNGGNIVREFYNTEMGNAFKIMQRPSCYNCQFREKKHKSDLTIGDYHGNPKMTKIYQPLGTSIIIVNSPKGKDFFNCINKKTIIYDKIDFETVYNHNRNSMDMRREPFSVLLANIGLIKAIDKTISKKDKLKMILPVSFVRFMTVQWRKVLSLRSWKNERP